MGPLRKEAPVWHLWEFLHLTSGGTSSAPFLPPGYHHMDVARPRSVSQTRAVPLSCPPRKHSVPLANVKPQRVTRCWLTAVRLNPL